MAPACVAEVGGEDAQADLVVVLELVERGDGGVAGQLELGPSLPSAAGSAIEPETSITSSTRAALRCSAHLSSILTSTAGSGTSSTFCGWFGSTPLAATIGAPTATAVLPGRKPYSSTCAWFSGCCT